MYIIDRNQLIPRRQVVKKIVKQGCQQEKLCSIHKQVKSVKYWYMSKISRTILKIVYKVNNSVFNWATKNIFSQKCCTN